MLLIRPLVKIQQKKDKETPVDSNDNNDNYKNNYNKDNIM